MDETIDGKSTFSAGTFLHIYHDHDHEFPYNGSWVVTDSMGSGMVMLKNPNGEGDCPPEKGWLFYDFSDFVEDPSLYAHCY